MKKNERVREKDREKEREQERERALMFPSCWTFRMHEPCTPKRRARARSSRRGQIPCTRDIFYSIPPTINKRGGRSWNDTPLSCNFSNEFEQPSRFRLLTEDKRDSMRRRFIRRRGNEIFTGPERSDETKFHPPFENRNLKNFSANRTSRTSCF